jgi:thioesterase domain-containing protein/acyl carrier protein
VDVRENLGEIVARLEEQGFDTAVMQDRLLAETELFYLYAIAPWTGRKLMRDQAEGAHLLPLPLLPPPFLTPEDLLARLRDHLPEPMIPSAFAILESLPLTANGKLDREALPETRSLRPGLRVPYLAPRDAVELGLVQLWQEILGVRPIGVRDSFFDLGGHSLLVAPLMSRIEREFGRQLSLAAVFASPTVERLACELSRQGGAPASPVLPIQPHGSRPPLFLVHPLGGSALCYIALSQLLGPDQPVYGLDCQFLDRRDWVYPSLAEMAREYVQALCELRPEGPYRLGGWSFGGLVAYEMAQQLVCQGADVDFLVLLDSSIPALRGEPATVDETLVLLELLGPSLGLAPEELRKLDADEQVRHVVEQGRRAGTLPLGYDENAARKLMALVRMNSRNGELYVPQKYPGLITYIQACPAGQPPGGPMVDPWRELSAEELDLRLVTGTAHREMLSLPWVVAVAEHLAACLDQVQGAQESLVPPSCR